VYTSNQITLNLAVLLYKANPTLKTHIYMFRSERRHLMSHQGFVLIHWDIEPNSFSKSTSALEDFPA